MRAGPSHRAACKTFPTGRDDEPEEQGAKPQACQGGAEASLRQRLRFSGLLQYSQSVPSQGE